MQQFDRLYNSTQTAFLVNVRVAEGRLYCGFAYFDRGLGDITELLSDGGDRIQIFIPEQVKHTLTYVLMTDVKDRIEFQIAG